ncbi:MAG: hypothetical protein K1X74_21105 [Pirellulales bacterium]|nr:hypothetical protein [Pirellulales bacterium]
MFHATLVRPFLLAGWGLLLTIALGLTPGLARAEISAADKELAQRVFDRLVASATPVEGWAWPPKLNFLDTDEVQAYATLDTTVDPIQPLVFVHRGILDKVIQGKEERLALLLGHELSHITCKHVKGSNLEKTPLVEFAATREQEDEADIEGLKLAGRAGYSAKGCLDMFISFINAGLEYSSFEALKFDHPSAKQRLAHIDEQQSEIWHAMAAFETGVQFLLFENYIAAERCFRQVTEDFPKCHEAWANLGYSRLMEYCDQFSEEDLKEFDLGPLVIGAFYQRPDSLQPESLRTGPDSDLWFDAVGALREALRLDPNSMLAAANLGIAYLVAPEGKDVGQAAKFLDLAAKLAGADESQPLLARAAVLANAGVTDLLEGQSEEGLARLQSAQTMQAAFAGDGTKEAISPIITAAITFHKAVLLSASAEADQQQQALDLFEHYLSLMSTASAWWPMGYEHYTQLCKQLGKEPKPANSFTAKAENMLRPVSTLSLGNELVVGVSESLKKLKPLLGEGQVISTVPGTTIRRLRFDKYKVTLLATDNVLGICLTDEQGPPLVLRPAGVATKQLELRIGMSKEQLDELLGAVPYDYRQLTDPDVNYRFYRQLGIAVRVKQGKVIELIVVQIPERRSIG